MKIANRYEANERALTRQRSLLKFLCTLDGDKCNLNSKPNFRNVVINLGLKVLYKSHCDICGNDDAVVVFHNCCHFLCSVCNKSDVTEICPLCNIPSKAIKI